MRSYLRLGKIAVMIPVSFSAFTGYFLFSPRAVHANLLFTLGVLCLGMSASAINQWQEKSFDAQMVRTRQRPLPLGKINTSWALGFILLCLLAGSWLVFSFGSLTALLLGLFNMAWYNLVYTPLKPKTAFAVIPGALTGAIPPLMGWVAAGGMLADYTALLVAFVFFIGQVPHFWLILLKYGEEYREAGFKTLFQVFSRHQVHYLTFTWMSVAFLAALFLPAFGIVQHLALKIILTGLVLISTGLAFLFLRKEEPGNVTRRRFALLNAFYLLLMLVLIADKLPGI